MASTSPFPDSQVRQPTRLQSITDCLFLMSSLPTYPKITALSIISISCTACCTAAPITNSRAALWRVCLLSTFLRGTGESAMVFNLARSPTPCSMPLYQSVYTMCLYYDTGITERLCTLDELHPKPWLWLALAVALGMWVLFGSLQPFCNVCKLHPHF